MPVCDLNCGTLRPIWPRIEAIVYCLLVPTDYGLLLVGTGLGLQDYCEAAMAPRGLLAWGCQRCQWSHGPHCQLPVEVGGEWLGFPRLRVG